MTENNSPHQEPNSTPQPPPPPNVTPPFQQQPPPQLQPQRPMARPPRRRGGSFLLGLLLLFGFMIFSVYLLISSFLPSVSLPDYTLNTVAVLEIEGRDYEPHILSRATGPAGKKRTD